MIERLLEKSDFNKIFEDAKAKEYFIELLQNEEQCAIYLVGTKCKYLHETIILPEDN